MPWQDPKMKNLKWCTSILIIAMHTLANTLSTQEIGTMNNLVLQIEPLPEEVPLRKPIEVKVSLTNKGEERVLVNRRMAVGYENSLSRELYLQLERVDRPEDLEYIEYDINRDFSPSDDYRWLGPGESVNTTFDLMDFYHLTKPGTYRLTAYYQADEELADTPDEIYPGTVKSDPVIVKIVGYRMDRHEK